jgi:hypothetical protein
MRFARVDGARERERGSFYCADAARRAHVTTVEGVAQKKIRIA